MSPTELARARDAAQYLREAHRTRARFGAMAEPVAPRSVDEAYAVQDAFVELKSRQFGPIAGYKLALTTPQMRRMVGHDDSVAGTLLQRQLRRSPAAVRASDYARLLVEFEIALQLGADLPAENGPFSRESVAHAVESVMPAFELADDRDADYALMPRNVLVLIADNAWNEGVVLGTPERSWRTLDLAALRGVVTLNGQSAGEGRGGDALGHPLAALAWLAEHLAARGRSLRSGDIVITGSLVTSKFPNPGDQLKFSVEALGEVTLRVD